MVIDGINTKIDSSQTLTIPVRALLLNDPASLKDAYSSWNGASVHGYSTPNLLCLLYSALSNGSVVLDLIILYPIISALGQTSTTSASSPNTCHPSLSTMSCARSVQGLIPHVCVLRAMVLSAFRKVLDFEFSWTCVQISVCCLMLE